MLINGEQVNLLNGTLANEVLDELVLPFSHYRELSYYSLKNLAIELALGYYARQDKKSLTLYPRRRR
ncbi:hypothetical protein [Pectobacterium sp. B2J-2]|uniref:hypothetical protein n=1 Tax=Pectobacterium sp. B2J-2 TaxID=3385372 RepID=UPI0038FBF5D4